MGSCIDMMQHLVCDADSLSRAAQISASFCFPAALLWVFSNSLIYDMAFGFKQCCFFLLMVCAKGRRRWCVYRWDEARDCDLEAECRAAKAPGGEVEALALFKRFRMEIKFWYFVGLLCVRPDALQHRESSYSPVSVMT